MDLNQINKVFAKLADNEKISLPMFASKLSRVLKEYPEDQTIGMMNNIVARMSNKNSFITRAEIKNLYQKLYCRNTKFAEIFKDELGEMPKLASAKLYDRSEEKADVNTDSIVDQELTSVIASFWGDKIKSYTETQAKNVKFVVNAAIDNVRLNSKVDVVGGESCIVLCLATFETPKGLTSIFIPVEVYGEKVVSPSIFIGNNGSERCVADVIEAYAVDNAGDKLNLNADLVLKAISNAKKTEISNVDFVVAKLRASRGKQEVPGIYAEMEPEAQKEVSSTVYIDPEMSSFAKVFETPTGVAEFKFGKGVVNAGREIISTKLKSLGLNSFQIAVCDSASQLVFAVSTGTSAFKVPLNVENGLVGIPAVIITNGSIESFSKAGLERVFKKESVDYKTAAIASPGYQLKASELVDIVRQSVSEENYDKAEDALNVLATRGDDKAYKTAFDAYMNGLTGKKVEQTSCNMVRESSTSKHKICGHTGLPLHKVYQDKNGNCSPMYRKAMVDTKEGAYFMNSKIFI
jgi:hypothetical protein